MKIFYIAGMFFLLSCSGSDKQNSILEQADSVSSPTTYASDTTVRNYEDRFGEDTADNTIKPLKGVYFQFRKEAWVRYELENEDEVRYEMPFGQYLEVLEEHELFYKVRNGYGRHADVFFISKELVTDQFIRNTDLFFPGYTFHIQNFMGEEIGDDYPESDTLDWKPYYTDETGVFKGLIVKKDTMFISENLDHSVTMTQIRIIPSNKNDRYKVSIAFMQSVNEIEDYRETGIRTPKPADYKWFSLEQVTAYKPLKDSANYYFNIPDSITQAEYKANTLFLKQKYKFKDTSIVIPGEYDTYVSFFQGKLLFAYGITHVYLRVERIANGKIASVKYVVISINDSC